MDANGDGIGDLQGIHARLPYVAELGADAIWLTPIYPSPMRDFGYDVADYCDVDSRFGTLSDFDALLARAHQLGLRVILDYVVNHTSDLHPWFQESASSRENPKRDWYIWRDPRPDGGAPNNWLSEFGGSAWQWHEPTGQYYYHAYLKEQPDLNWRNPDVRRAMHQVLRFWLDRGVDGFRVDAIHHLIKDAQLRDNPDNPDYEPRMPPHRRLIRRFTTDQPEVHDEIAAMRRVLDEYPDRVLIGEAWLPYPRLAAYYGIDLSGLHLPFNFELIRAKWEASVLAALAREYEAVLPDGAWPNWVLGNHDRSRIATRVGSAQARVAAMLLLTLRGTPTLYYGDELGMRDVAVPAESVRDPFEKNVPGLGVGRDPERTPMQWSAERNAGFTSGVPWLPLDRDFPLINVEVQRSDPESMLTLYRNLIALRRSEPALHLGAYEALEVGPEVYAFRRSHADRRLGVFLNLTATARELRLPVHAPARVLLSTVSARTGTELTSGAMLLANEGVIAEL
jgi:alpha-glucosidase